MRERRTKFGQVALPYSRCGAQSAMPFLAFDQQVIVDARVAGQGAVQGDINQMNKRLAAYRNDRAFPGIEGDVSYTLQAQGQRQWARTDQPQHQSRRLQPSQQRAGQDRRQRDQVIGCG